MLLRRLRQGEQGQSILEYALLLAILVLAVVAGMHTLAGVIGDGFSHASTSTSVAGNTSSIIGADRITVQDFHITRPQVDPRAKKIFGQSTKKIENNHFVSHR